MRKGEGTSGNLATGCKKTDLAPKGENSRKGKGG